MVFGTLLCGAISLAAAHVFAEPGSPAFERKVGGAGMSALAIVRKMSPKERERLSEYIAMLTRKRLTTRSTKKFRAKFLKLFNKNLSDIDIVTALRNSLRSLEHISSEQEGPRELRRSQKRMDDIAALLPQLNSSSTVLDVGCADGALLRLLGDRFKVPSERLIGVDVRPAESLGFTFHEADASALPLADASVDVALVMMAMHHFEHADAVLAELHRVLRPGGVVVIREHDLPLCGGVHDKGISCTFSHAFVDFAHVLYSCIMNDRETPKEYLANYFVMYRGRSEFNKLFATAGFDEDQVTDVSDNDPFRTFYAVYKKAS